MSIISFYYYGAIYHRLFDPQLAEASRVALDLAAELHELPRPQQACVLKEALRVASKCNIIDAAAPLPKNAGGLGIRIVEGTFGHDHQRSFKAFLASGGIRGMLEESGLPISVEQSSVFWRNCREVVMVSTQL